MTLILLSYNNYFNRVIKRDTLEGYLAHKNKYITNYPFQVRDGVNTDIKVTWTDSWTPDYCIVINENDVIVSRWFIRDTNRINANQIEAQLQRDLVADFYEDIISAPCFVEKGYVSTDNPLLFNKENFACNQIKQGEALLYDKSECSWVVVYFSNTGTDMSNLQGDITLEQETPYLTLNTPITGWELYQYTQTATRFKQPNTLGLTVLFDKTPANHDEQVQANYTYNSDNKLVRTEAMTTYASDVGCTWYNETGTSEVLNYGTKCLDKVMYNTSGTKSRVEAIVDPGTSIETLLKYDGKLIKCVYSDGGSTVTKYYRIRVSSAENVTDFIKLTYGTTEQDYIKNQIINSMRDNANISDRSDNKGWFYSSGNVPTLENAVYVKMTGTVYNLDYTDVTSNVGTIHYDFRNFNNIKDQPYGILAMPFKHYANRPIQIGINSQYQVDGLSLAIASDLCRKGKGTYIYDAQILPYCPLDFEMRGGIIWPALTLDGNLVVDAYVEDKDYCYVKDSNNTKLCLCLFPSSTQFTKDLYKGINVIWAGGYIEQSNWKVDNETKLFRLVSPNWNGQFEFNAAKLKTDNFAYFHVDCTYKPYAPYIHVNPVWSGLYGENFGDAVGLICGGDFSMTTISDAWETYQIQNKNFQAIFDRQIENMDVQHDIQKTQARVQAITGGITGGAAGMAAGAMVGGPVGMVVGGLLGAGASAAGGVADYKLLEKQQAESRDYTIDMHNYQLDNIKALPHNLTKVDAYNNNNKMFPFLEVYSCTDEEREIFKNKLKYEGMTVGAIGTIAEYVNPTEQTFVKGELIRLPNIEEDAHVVYSIYDEIKKGVYL